MRILLADDDPDVRLVVRLTLEKAGHSVVAVGNGQAVLDIVETQCFDVILLDVIMPVLDGRMVCQRLRANIATQSTPVVFLSATPQPPSEWQRLGAQGAIVKPFDILTLNATVATYLGSSIIVE